MTSRHPNPPPPPPSRHTLPPPSRHTLPPPPLLRDVIYERPHTCSYLGLRASRLKVTNQNPNSWACFLTYHMQSIDINIVCSKTLSLKRYANIKIDCNELRECLSSTVSSLTISIVFSTCMHVTHQLCDWLDVLSACCIRPCQTTGSLTTTVASFTVQKLEMGNF